MKKKCLLQWLIMLCSSVSFGQMDRVKEVTDTAGKGYQAYLEKIPDGQESITDSTIRKSLPG